MDKILSEKTFAEQLNELKNVEFKVTQNRGKPVLEQTKRNLVRKQLLDSLFEYFCANFEDVNIYRVADGIAFEIDNESVYEVSKPILADLGSGSGAITITLDATIHDLSYDAYEASEIYADDIATKEAQKQARAEKAQKAKAAKEAK